MSPLSWGSALASVPGWEMAWERGSVPAWHSALARARGSVREWALAWAPMSLPGWESAWARA
ncbi:MAG: hypothetical protein WEE66_14935 [Actinomycetota bacterium]